ncbi:uncharacterized protein K452DRAFT_294665 [Aplosporella prunicola CBS 121167]|uniref:Autophagy-related protein 1 n=1 Tax=Aplosporella prunicola CBS 121167 TaxID=1176127 RepID=A0A6A6BRY9_9PEZI|nr:uncharacterized protein K452DRAFT_294665 [Aplosporella prunicola CBS 121167]KAF2146055.1 hypothetical protein K452DRAFT_294665 [Aplosporella prunicola CBS 121167]
MECLRNQFTEGVVLDGRFETLSALNHGSFGMVFMAKDLKTGENVAVKCLTKTSDPNTCPSAFAIDERSEELVIHRRLSNHPNIVDLVHTFETKNHVYLVLELCPNGDLYEAIRLGRGPLETEHVRDFMYQLIDAVEFMHSNGIYHRDIKPENIFLTSEGDMKLGDFGLATTDELSYESAVGSDRYMAPEQYDCGDNAYSPAKADIWAVGICLLNVLFSRNPFATPTFSDPLFADFVSDRQSLFDVFPNMSQDTYEVLVHCLAIEPNNRSLSATRKALGRVISFTIDDESLDEFCVEDCEVIGATANREPLRTPSVSTAQLDANGAFPWAKALAMTPPQPVRQLSAIPDVDTYSEDLFPASERTSGDWCSIKPETSSIVSFVDSGLGISLKSNNNVSQPRPINSRASRPMQIPGSMPARPMPNLGSVLDVKKDMVSKSWSDLWDEDEEDDGSETENVVQQMLGFKDRVWSHETGSGRTTPRAGLSELKDPENINNSRNRSPITHPKVDDYISEQTGFIFEDHPAMPRSSSPKSLLSTPKKQHLPVKRTPVDKREKMNNVDKWAALGNRRRAPLASEREKPAPAMPASSPTLDRKRSRAYSNNWRRNMGTGFGGHYSTSAHHGFEHGVGHHGKGHQDWRNKDWRQHPVVHTGDDDIGDLEHSDTDCLGTARLARGLWTVDHGLWYE